MKVGIKLFDGLMPYKGSKGAACFDLRSAVSVDLPIGSIVKVPLGLQLELPENYAAFIYSRSGLASQGIIVANQPGVIDSDYHGEVCVLLVNHGGKYHICRGDRIAQMEIRKLDDIELEKIIKTEYKESSIEKAGYVRGEKGFGSTGT